MVMGGDSCTEACVFESQHQTHDGHFSHIFVLQLCFLFFYNYDVCLKRRKRGRGWPIFISFYLYQIRDAVDWNLNHM